MAAGLVDEARAALDERGPRLRRAARLRQRQGEAELALARALAVDDPAAARRWPRRAARPVRARRRARLAGAGRRGARWSRLASSATRTGAGQPRGRRAGRHAARRGSRVDGAAGRAGRGPGPDAATAARRGPLRRWPRLRPRRADPLAVRLLSADVAGRARRGDGPGAAALAHVRGRPRRAARRGRARSGRWTCRPTSSATACGSRCAGWRWRCSRASDAVLLEWSERARMLASRIQPVRAPQDPQTVADLAELRAGPDAGARGRAAPAGPGAGLAAPGLRRGRGPGAPGRRCRTGWARTRRWSRTSSPPTAWSRWWSPSAGTGPPRPRRALAARRRCSAGCCPTWTWRRPSCPTPLAGSVRGTLAAPARPPWPRCWSPRCSPDLGDRRRAC